MATYTELTDQQKSTLEYLSNRMQRITQSNDDKKTKAKNIAIVKEKVNEVYSAQEEFNKCIIMAYSYIIEGERLQKEYGVTWTPQ